MFCNTRWFIRLVVYVRHRSTAFCGTGWLISLAIYIRHRSTASCTTGRFMNLAGYTRHRSTVFCSTDWLISLVVYSRHRSAVFCIGSSTWQSTLGFALQWLQHWLAHHHGGKRALSRWLWCSPWSALCSQSSSIALGSRSSVVHSISSHALVGTVAAHISCSLCGPTLFTAIMPWSRLGFAVVWGRSFTQDPWSWQIACRGYGGRDVCVCLITYTALHDLCILHYAFCNLRGARVEQHGLYSCSSPWCDVCIQASKHLRHAHACTRSYQVGHQCHTFACIYVGGHLVSFKLVVVGVSFSAGLQVVCVSTSTLLQFLFNLT
jgi:hypothetical protein